MRIKKLVQKTGCGKVNIIAHSKGGLDSRYAISRLGCDKYVSFAYDDQYAHHGCLFAGVSAEYCAGVFVRT